MTDLNIPGIGNPGKVWELECALDGPIPQDRLRAATAYDALPRVEKIRRALAGTALVLAHNRVLARKDDRYREACFRIIERRRAVLRVLWEQEAADKAAWRQVAATGELGRLIMGEKGR